MILIAQTIAGGEECGAPGDLVNWEEAQWTLNSQAKVIEVDRELEGRKESQVQVFTADFGNHPYWVRQYQKISVGESDQGGRPDHLRSFSPLLGKGSFGFCQNYLLIHPPPPNPHPPSIWTICATFFERQKCWSMRHSKWLIIHFEEIDSFYWPKVHFWKVAKKFGQGPPPSSFGQNPKEQHFFSETLPLYVALCHRGRQR